MRSPQAPLLALLVAGFAIAAVTGCGATTDGDSAAGETTGGDAAAGACLTGSTDCEDIPSGTGGPSSQPDGSVLLADAVAAGIDGPFLVQAFYLADASGERLCSALAESFPPQCAEPSLVLDNTAGADLGDLTVEGDVSWSESTITLEGEILDGSFVTR